MTKKNWLWPYMYVCVVLVEIAVLSGCCGIYSFTGANLSPKIKTISIENFINRAGDGPAILSQKFTEKAREYYQRNTTLSLVNIKGDLQIEGQIVGYNFSPIAPTGNEVASQTRLTITIKVRFVNTIDESQNFDQNFSFYDDFAQSASISSVENRLIENITDQIILDIFNKTVANW